MMLSQAPDAVRLPGVWDSEHRWLTAGVIGTVSATAFEALAVATVLPGVVQELGGVQWYGWAFSGFLLTNLLGISLAGTVADRRGVATAFAVGSALFVGGLIGAGLATHMIMVVASRTAQGFGAGAMGAAGYAVIARGYPEELRARMLAMMSSAWVIPGMVGPSIAAAVAGAFGWRWVFLGIAPLTALAAVAALPSMRMLQPSAVPAGDDAALWPALRLALGAAAILGGIAGASAASSFGLIAVGAVLALPGARLLIPPVEAAVQPAATAAAVTMALVSAAFFGAEAFLPLGLTVIRAQTTALVGVTLTAAALCWTTGAWLQARWVTRRSRRRITIEGALLIVVAIVGVCTTLFASVPPVVAVAAWGVSGLGMGLAYSTTALVVLESAAQGREGAASAALQLANVLGAAIGTGVAGACVTFAGGGDHVQRSGLVVADLLMIATALASLGAAWKLPARTVPLAAGKR